MTEWDQVPDETTIQETIVALNNNGINSEVVNSGAEAKAKIIDMIPVGSEVFEATSATVESIGIPDSLRNLGNYVVVKDKIHSLNKDTQAKEIRAFRSSPDYVVGSVHAVTHDGHVLIASATGSQMASYVYGASHVIWVVGAQKIVKNTNEGINRIYDYVFPLENERARKAYGTGSAVNKLLIINKEVEAGRIHLIIVREKLGF